MAHFAEIDSIGKVLRVAVACNQDIANNGGELSEQAAEHFKTVCPLSSNGVKWVQTSYNNNFRNKYAYIDCFYNKDLDKFLDPQPYPSWNLDENFQWKPPISSTPKLDWEGVPLNEIDLTKPPRYKLSWNEDQKKFFLERKSDQTIFEWNPDNSTWIQL
jgi:hypothetical protein